MLISARQVTHRVRWLIPLLAVLAIAFGTVSSVLAQDGPPSVIDGTILFEVQNDHAFDSDDPSAEINDLFATVEAALGLNFNEIFSVQSLFVLEPVLDPRPFDDRYFEDHGLFVEELYFQAQFENYRFFVGKFDATFGTAWDAAPGIYGVDFAEDYELVERIGGGGEVAFEGTRAGDVTFTGSVFFTDTSVLSESAFTNRGRTRIAAGGASNTESLESFSITVDGENVPGLEDLTYHLGYRHQSAGRGDVDDEDGFVAGIQKAFALSEDVTLETILEGVYLSNDSGSANDTVYFTAGGALLHGPWNLSTSFTLRDQDVPGGPDNNDRLFQVSGGYAFDFGLTADAGYRYSREGGVETHIFGLLFTYEYEIGSAIGIFPSP